MDNGIFSVTQSGICTDGAYRGRRIWQWLSRTDIPWNSWTYQHNSITALPIQKFVLFIGRLPTGWGCVTLWQRGRASANPFSKGFPSIISKNFCMVTLLCCFVALLCEFADVHIKRSINFIGYIFAVLFALFNALGQRSNWISADRVH